jgi:4-hydroxy-tetrahydrodipicolinate synthase
MIDLKTNKTLKGVIPAIIVPLNEDGQINAQLLWKQSNYLASSGVQGFFVNGTTGEGAWLSTEEKIKVLKVVREIKKQEQFLCAACIQPSTEMVLREIEIFAPLGPDFIVSVTPYYYSVSQNDILWHFNEIAQHSPVPIIVYHIPQNTHNPIEFSTILELSRIDNIAGIKDSSGNFINFSRACLNKVPEQFSWIQGEDYLDAASLNIGADGMVTGLGNVYIEPYIKMYQAAQANDVKKVFQMQRKINELYEIIQVTGIKVIPSIKAAASLLGRSHKWMKMASQALNTQEVNRLKEVLKKLSLIK